MTYKLAKTSQDADPYFGAVSLLLDGTDFQDKSLDTKTITVNGNPEVRTGQSKWNGSSLYLDGSNDYLYAGTDSSFAFGTGDFTIECWLRRNGNQIDKTGILSTSTAANTGSWQLDFFSGQKLSFRETANVVFTSTDVLQDQTWYHVAVTRESGTFKLFVDGVLDQTNSISVDFTYEDLRVGTNRAFSKTFKGHIQDVRITKGVARYTANFTPPTQPFFGAINPDQDRYFYATSLLLHGDGTNGSTTIVDSSDESNTITAAGNGQISTAQSKFGGSSLAFNAGYFTTPYSLDLFDWWTAPHTIEAWVYVTNFATTEYNFLPIMIGNINPTSVTNYWSFGVNRDARVRFFWFTGSVQSVYSATNVVSLNTWTHIAMTHESGTVRLFADGALVASTSSLGNPQSSSGTPLSIGAWNNTSMDNIYVDDLRITKGAARYTSNFTPPTKAFPDY